MENRPATIPSLAVLLTVPLVLFYYAGCAPIPPQPPATAGDLWVYAGYGSTLIPGGTCGVGGGETFDVSLDNGLPQTVKIERFFYTQVPTCRGRVVFGQIAPGAHVVRLDNASCTATIIAGQQTTVYIRTDNGISF